MKLISKELVGTLFLGDWKSVVFSIFHSLIVDVVLFVLLSCQHITHRWSSHFFFWTDGQNYMNELKFI